MSTKPFARLTLFTIGLISTLALGGCSSAPPIKYDSPNAWVQQSRAGQQLPLATKAGEWSEPKNFQLPSGLVAVRSEFVKHHGSTCHFNVEFTNIGTTPISATAGLTQEDKKNIYTHNSGRLNLQPGAKVTYDDLEARECPIRLGTHTEMDHCAACMTAVLFANH